MTRLVSRPFQVCRCGTGIDCGELVQKYRYARGMESERMPASRITDADIARLVAAVEESEVFQWMERKMKEPAPEVVQQTRYAKFRERVDHYANLGVRKTQREICTELGFPALERHGRPWSDSVVIQPPIAPALFGEQARYAKVKEKANYYANLGVRKTSTEINAEIDAGR